MVIIRVIIVKIKVKIKVLVWIMRVKWKIMKMEHDKHFKMNNKMIIIEIIILITIKRIKML